MYGYLLQIETTLLWDSNDLWEKDTISIKPASKLKTIYLGFKADRDKTKQTNSRSQKEHLWGWNKM